MADETKVFDTLPAGIGVASPFKYQGENPLDVREKVPTISDRNKLIPEHGAWKGMRVYVEETNTVYVLKGATNDDWEEEGGGAIKDIQAQLNIAKVKTLAAVPDSMIDAGASYVADVYYNNDEIIYLTSGGNVRVAKNIQGKSNANASTSIGANCDSLFVDDDAVWILSIEEKKVYKRNRSTLAAVSTYSLTIDNTLASSDYTNLSIHDSRFCVVDGKIILSIQADKDSEARNFVIAYDTAEDTSAIIANGGIDICYIGYDYLNMGVFYVFVNEKAMLFESSTTSSKTVTFDRSIVSNGDYFNHYYIGLTSPTQYELFDLANEKSYTIDFESEELPTGNTTVHDVLIKKITLDNKIQFYLGLANGVVLKMVVDLNTLVEGKNGLARLMYEFIDPYMKNVKCMRADDLKNTEKIMLVFSTMANQIRILSENVEVAGATKLSEMDDRLNTAESELNDKADSSWVTTQINAAKDSINTDSMFRSRGMFPIGGSLNDLNSYDDLGIWAVTASTNTPEELPLGRTAGEIVYVGIYANAVGNNSLVQTIHYTKQHKRFSRYYDGTAWSPLKADDRNAYYAECETATATVAKTASCPGYVLETGAEITVKFVSGNTAASPTLNVNSTGAKAIHCNGEAIPKDAILADGVYKFVYDGTNYVLIGNLGYDDTEIRTLINNKVDKVSGKGLSTNDYTTTEKNKLAAIAAGATKVEDSTTNGNIKINGVEKTVYTHPSNHAASMITQDSTHRFVTDTEKSTWNGKLSSSSVIDGGTF